MEYILQFARILGFCLAGEVLHYFLPLPVPASIYGLLLMFAALQTGLLKPERVKAASAFLIAVFPIMFVPGTVGVMDLWDELARLVAPLLLATFAITGLVFAVAGHVTQALTRDPELLNSFFGKLSERLTRKTNKEEKEKEGKS